MTDDSLKRSVARQRTALYNMLVEPMGYLASRCAKVWKSIDQLDRVLMDGITTLPNASFLYAMDAQGIQISCNATHDHPIEKDRGRNRSQRPYMREPVPENGLLLSEAYISLRAKRPSLTAVQKVTLPGSDHGYLGADFDLRNLPLTGKLYREPQQWQQMKGDPAIRGQLFHQTRVESLLDRHIDDVLAVVEELVTERGVFHAKLHFSSSRATIWHVDDPFRYRILGYEALSDPDICLVYPRTPYPAEAVITQPEVNRVFAGFRRLRFADDVIYLRAGSLNIFNGMVSLNFSCDGSHYLPYRQFLQEDSPFWRSVA